MLIQLDDINYYLLRMWCFSFKIGGACFLCGYTRGLCYHTAVHPSRSPCGIKPGGPCSIGQIRPHHSSFYLTKVVITDKTQLIKGSVLTVRIVTPASTAAEVDVR
jgi:hypothetical protein